MSKINRTKTQPKSTTLTALSCLALLLTSTTLAAIPNCKTEDNGTCTVCDTNYGPSIDKKSCLECNKNDIVNLGSACTQCEFLKVFNSLQKKLVDGANCMKCKDDKHFIKFFFKDFARKCIPCEPQCETCGTEGGCVSCSSMKTLDKKKGSCTYSLGIRAGFSVGLLGVALAIFFVMKCVFCSKVGEMEKVFIVHDASAGNYVDVNRLMQRPEQYNQYQQQQQYQQFQTQQQPLAGYQAPGNGQGDDVKAKND